jgi:hypothetical protein
MTPIAMFIYSGTSRMGQATLTGNAWRLGRVDGGYCDADIERIRRGYPAWGSSWISILSVHQETI